MGRNLIARVLKTYGHRQADSGRIKPGSETVKNPDPDPFRPQNQWSRTQNPKQTTRNPLLKEAGLTKPTAPTPPGARWLGGRPPLITEHHSGSSLNDLAREASPSSRYLRPARDEDTTYTVGGNCSRVDGDKRTDNIETRSYSPDASVDQTEANETVQRRRSIAPPFRAALLKTALGDMIDTGRACSFRSKQPKPSMHGYMDVASLREVLAHGEKRRT